MTTSNRAIMGGNGSYDSGYGGVPPEKRTHNELEGYRILGHKILWPKDSPRAKPSMNSNTANQVYVIGSVDTSDKNSKTGVISVHSVAFYEGNHIKYTVDVKYDTSGKVSSYKVNGGEGTTHAHKWIEVKPGIWGRKSGAKNNHLPPDSRWSQDLIKAIEAFNAKKIKVKYGD